jgi:Fe-S cluster biogenesis protein NfuA
MYTEPTPNPLAIKFVLGKPVTDGMNYLVSSEKETGGITVLEEIFALPGIDCLLLTPEFITITFRQESALSLLESIVLSTFHHYLDSFPLSEQAWDNAPFPSEEKPWPSSGVHDDIKTIVQEYIQPAIEADGGSIHLKSFENGVLCVQLQGACSGCPHSQETLINGIERTLKYYIPEIQSVYLY